MRKLVIALVLIVLGIVSGFYLNSYMQKSSKVTERETADVILEQVNKVLKVVTVEGEFSEIYAYDNIWHLFFYPAQKKALVRVNATVMVGYDMEGVDIDVAEKNRKVIIKNIPPPKILSLEKSLDYYDLSESRFNQFKEKDFNLIEKRTEAQIKEKVNQSDLYIKAEEQLSSYIETLQMILKEYGWSLERESYLTGDEIHMDSLDK